MDEHHIVRSMLLRIGRGHPATSSIAKAITEWAQPHAAWLTGAAPEALADGTLGWDALMAGIATEAPPGDCVRPHALLLAAALARLLAFEPVDSALLELMVACDRLSRVSALAEIASQNGHELPALLGVLAGVEAHDAERVVRQSPVLRLDLVNF